ERLRRETSLARTGLSFAPSLLIAVDGEHVRDDDPSLAPSPAEQLDARVADDIADDVVAVVREGLANAARHARASSVQVRVTVRGSGPAGQVSVQVEDDGVGVDGRSTRRSGLDNLAVRAGRHAGTFSLTPSDSGTGTLLSWQAPLT